MIKLQKPVPADMREVLGQVDQIVRAHGIDYLVIGATARDLMFEYAFGLPPTRGTRDVDFALLVEGWEQFDQVKADLLHSGRFGVDVDRVHRLYFNPGRNQHSYPIDLIPFGSVERAGHEIAWPPDMHMVMSVAGYSDALQAALLVDVGNGLTVPVVSVPGLICLKLVAWRDRRHESGKDAEDLQFMLSNYGDAANNERLYEEHMDLLEECGYDIPLAGAHLLGIDARRVVSAATLAIIEEIIDVHHDRLEAAISRTSYKDRSEPDPMWERFVLGFRTIKKKIDLEPRARKATAPR